MYCYDNYTENLSDRKALGAYRFLKTEPDLSSSINVHSDLSICLQTYRRPLFFDCLHIYEVDFAVPSSGGNFMLGAKKEICDLFMIRFERVLRLH